MKLSIDNTTHQLIKLSLDTHTKEISYTSPRDQDVLLEIQTFLNEQKVSLSELTAIQVATGPGRFTALRTSIAIAQSLAFALNIPINNLPPGTSIEAIYGQAPNITQPKTPY